ncbi:MAG: asparagine synthase (glutamine-hydrolyzing) [Lentisphaerae bacterium GWF2_44_16]|nr:MAG: asparagine synthase (glutamine-hydrolyzing) [Lentisphaerae bacterium GWF2_44_16]
MCGIIGYVSNSGKAIENCRKNVERVLEIMRFRGPDGNGIETGKNWIFGHTRLAVIDPKSGQQPWHDEKSGAVLTFNGEIYNFREIRELLRGRGHTFKSDCDTEVLLASYLEWGEKCLDKFNGFFSFAIADIRKNILFAARDRLGVKPFFYYSSSSEFCFSSVIPGVLEFMGKDFEYDMPAVSHYLTTGKPVFGDRAMIKGIKNLRPGHFIKLDMSDMSLDLKKYWGRPILAPGMKDKRPFDEAVLEVRALVEDSVRLRLVSDVPLGAFLSGGLDSAVITTLADKHSSYPLPLFCAGTDDEKSNEYKYAELIAEQLKTPLNRVSIGADNFAKDWAFLVSMKGMPLSTPNEISIYNLSAALRKQCTVTLTGEGADEVFGGYIQPHFSAYDFDRCARSAAAADTKSEFAMSMIMLYGRSFFINDTDHHTSTDCWFSYSARKSVFNDLTWKSIDEDNELFAFYEDFFDTVKDCSSFDKRMHLHAEFNLENLLSRIDNCSMSASVEARVPFTDYRLVEKVFSMPDSFKMNWRNKKAEEEGASLTATEIDRHNLLETKRLLRNAFRNDIPEAIVMRKKMSFPVPFDKWFYGPLLPQIKELCMSSGFTDKYFSKAEMENIFARKDRNLWLVANLCRWHEEIEKYRHSSE